MYAPQKKTHGGVGGTSGLWEAMCLLKDAQLFVSELLDCSIYQLAAGVMGLNQGKENTSAHTVVPLKTGTPVLHTPATPHTWCIWPWPQHSQHLQSASLLWWVDWWCVGVMHHGAVPTSCSSCSLPFSDHGCAPGLWQTRAHGANMRRMWRDHFWVLSGGNM